MRALVRGSVVAAALLALAAGASAEGSGLVITSPTSGQSVSRAAGPVVVTGTYERPAPEQDVRTLFLRRSQCASGGDDSRLALSPGGSTEQSGCGFVAQSANEVLIAQDGEGLSTVYPATEGVPVTLDATEPVTGTIRMNAGLGVVTAELEVRGTRAAGGAVDVLVRSVQTFNGTLGARNVTFSALPAAGLDKVDYRSVELYVRVRGVNVQSGSIDHRNGVSSVTLPVWTGSFAPAVVDVAVDSTTFAAARTRRAAVAGDGSWTVTLPDSLATLGTHTLSARAVTGAYRTDAETVTFTVTP